MTSNSNPPVVLHPLGITPRFILAERRCDEILAASIRFVDAGVPVPAEWADEYRDLLYYLGTRRV